MGNADETVREWDVATGKATKVIKDFPGWVHDIAITSDGKKLACGCAVWDEAKYRIIAGEVGDYWMLLPGP